MRLNKTKLSKYEIILIQLELPLTHGDLPKPH